MAELLARQLPSTSVYDPEAVGFVLRRLPSWLLGRSKQPDDFQDLWLWRHLIIRGARRAHRQAMTVIVPMAFSDRGYFDAFRDALGADAPVQNICLVAPFAIIQERLRARACTQNSNVSKWQLRRSEECWEAHARISFGRPIDATKSPQEIVDEIQQVIATGSGPPGDG